MSIALHPAAAPPAGAAARPYEAAPWLIGLAVFALAAFSPAVLNDGDTWTHVATGQWILAHFSVPRADPFSFPFAGQPWIAHEWLSEVLMALAFRATGWSGVALLTGMAAGAAVAIMARRAARDLGGPALLVVAALSALLIAPSLLARPHVLALPVLALWTIGLLSARERGHAPPIALAALMALWANLHGGFAFGLALIAPFALEALMAAPVEDRVKTLRDWGLFGLASLLAATVTPYGFETLLLPLRLLGLSHLGEIGEWRPENFAHPGPMEMVLLALVGFALIRPTSMPWLRAALLVLLIHMSLQHGRHQTLLALLAPMLIAPAIAQALGVPHPAKPRLSHEAILACAAAALALIGARIALPLTRVNSPTAPIAALRATPQALRDAPVLNGYPFGGYLIAAGVKPFIDGRADMYGDAFLDLYGKIASGDRETIEATLERYKIGWTIFAPSDAANATMDHEPGWRRLYADRFAVVHVRDEAPGAAELREGE